MHQEVAPVQRPRQAREQVLGHLPPPGMHSAHSGGRIEGMLHDVVHQHDEQQSQRQGYGRLAEPSRGRVQRSLEGARTPNLGQAAAFQACRAARAEGHVGEGGGGGVGVGSVGGWLMGSGRR